MDEAKEFPPAADKDRLIAELVEALKPFADNMCYDGHLPETRTKSQIEECYWCQDVLKARLALRKAGVEGG